jgi:DNA-binding NarL/FixJ family response regulator
MKMENEGAKTKVILVEDHPMFRDRLASLIRKDMQMTVCGETDNILDAIRLIQETRPDIAIVDITLRGSSGLELIKDLRAQGLSVPVLVLSMHGEALYAERALKAGASGYITKNEAATQVAIAIRRVLEGKVYLSETYTEQVLQKMSKSGTEAGLAGMASLSDRELEILRQTGCGLNAREIADKLSLGVGTVGSYRFRIIKKLNLKNSAELYSVAARFVQDEEG